MAGDVPISFKKETMATIKSYFNEYEVCFEFYVLPKITSKKPCFYHDVSKWNIPKNIQLADPMFNQPGRIDLLIGAEVFFELLSVGQICLGDNLPKLHKTVLGWIVAGKNIETELSVPKVYNLLVRNDYAEEEDLNNMVERFWRIEEINNKSSLLTEE